MEPGTLLLIALLVTLLVLVILQVRRSKKEREEREAREWAAAGRHTPSHPTTPYPTTSYPTTGAAPVVKMRMTHTSPPKSKARAPQPVSAQLTLYQQPMMGGKLVCPGCEGENDSSCCVCLICGQRIR